jgi:hypothetical protein
MVLRNAWKWKCFAVNLAVASFYKQFAAAFIIRGEEDSPSMRQNFPVGRMDPCAAWCNASRGPRKDVLD